MDGQDVHVVEDISVTMAVDENIEAEQHKVCDNDDENDDEFIEEVFEFDEMLTPNECQLLWEGYDLDGHADMMEENNEDDVKYTTTGLLVLLALDNDDDEDTNNSNKF